MFDLEKAIATWRRAYEVNPAFTDEDLEELEGSLRDRIEALSERMSEQEAFEVAVRRIGSLGKAEVEYKKVYWGKLKRERRITDELIWRISMFKNYVIIALRTLRKQMGYTFINISGLAIGLTCFMLIALFVQFELSYDTFHEKADRIYRIARETPGRSIYGINRYASTPPPLADALMEEFPEVEYAAQIQKLNALLSNEKNHFYEDGIYATEHFLNIFTFPLLQGDPHTALAEPNSIIITESMAQKYYGEENPMGRSLAVTRFTPWWAESNEEAEMKVTGIVADVPANSHLSFDYIISMSSYDDYTQNADHWDGNSYLTYAALRPDHSLSDFAVKLPELPRKHLSQIPYFQENPDAIYLYFPQAIQDIHLRSHFNGEFGLNGNITYVYLFSAIALLILLIACINYVNLATARSVSRHLEIGVRKVMGAHRTQLIRQFIGEAVIPSLAALVLALILVILLLPTFNALADREIVFDMAQGGHLLAVLVLIGLFLGILSGSYPAFVISAFHPVASLKGRVEQRAGRPMMRNALVVFQFTVTITLIICTLVIGRQVHYIRSTDTGLNRTQVVSVPIKDKGLIKQYAALKQTLQSHPSILGVTAADRDPTYITQAQGVRNWEGAEEGQSILLFHTFVEHDFVDVFDIELVEGRAFSEAITSDRSQGMLINETMKRQLGWEAAAGKLFNFRERENRIVGVIKDFNFLSFHQEMGPLALLLYPERTSHVLVKIQDSDVQETIAFLGETLSSFSPGYPFEYHFLDEGYNNLYQTEIRLGSLFSYFSFLALFIACMGLFGLAALTASQRTKEMGMRKILGASPFDLFMLLSKDFTRLVLVAFVLAAPFGYVMLSRWLQAFAYRISVGWGTFALAGGTVLLIAWLTISYQSMRAALANPVKILRHE